jgi:hypothetical protein
LIAFLDPDNQSVLLDATYPTSTAIKLRQEMATKFVKLLKGILERRMLNRGEK